MILDGEPNEQLGEHGSDEVLASQLAPGDIIIDLGTVYMYIGTRLTDPPLLHSLMFFRNGSVVEFHYADLDFPVKLVGRLP